MNYPKGSQWRKWDLHVHTPDSHVEHYSALSKEEAWERFIFELEQLPEEFKVIGINDYIFLDGYKKVLKYIEAGRLTNIDLFLPVIEFRLDKFGGTNSKLSRVNYHVIFSDQIKPEIIETHFLNAMPRKYNLSSDNSVLWNALPTRESIEELGRLIKKTIPEDKLSEYGSDLEEGFNNINFNKEQIAVALDSHIFKGKYLTAVGKTEWYDIKWNEQSIGEKKSIINDANFVFISSENIDLFQRAKLSLTDASVNDLLLDCSDAHYFSDSTEKDRIGKCYTWLKADTTFEGLKQILNEKKDRVYIGDIPPKLSKVQKNKTKYIKSLQVFKIENSKETDTWFSNEITFSNDLVAIIGNKGNGKSALADILSLVGNTKNYEDFSFLTKDKFRNNNLAKNFDAKIVWESGIEEAPVNLGSNPDQFKLEKVKYLPQQFLEKLCNNENSKFEGELKKVIFSHVGQEDRLNKNTLDELIEHNSTTIMQSIDIIKNQVVDLNRKIIKLENQSQANYINMIKENINNKKQELATHESSKPIEEKTPTDTSEVQSQLSEITALINTLNGSKGDLSIEIDIAQESLNKNKLMIAAIASLNEKLDNFEKQYTILKEQIVEELTLLELGDTELLSLKIERSAIQEKQRIIDAYDITLINKLSPNNEHSLINQKQKIESDIVNSQNKLDEPNKKYQLYISSLEQWERSKRQIVGDKDKPNTLSSFEYELEYIKTNLQQDLKNLLQDRENKTKAIYLNVSRLVSVLEKLYEPVQTYFYSHKLTDPEFQLNFEVLLNASNFVDGFLKFINQGVKGNFYGTIDGRNKIQTLLDNTNLSDPEKVIDLLNSIMFLLEERQNNVQKYEIENQLIKGNTKEELYNYIYSLEFLLPSYGLKLGDKELSKLSPGEKGALLLMFYLLVDKDDIPLIIDQPEENLDNQSVFNMLVPAIKSAKNHRQIIMVTHNPNLAVVCDAEQIIFARINKNEKNKIEYLSGAIENPVINQKIIDILEGTMPAFNNRDSKYFR
jgi:ABC-type lipoprotein export system ATPase subunit